MNLGGISNISFQKQNIRIAYDIAPANMLLNYLCKDISQPYDTGGKLAESGKLNTQLFDQLNSLSFYNQPYPKSLGYEWFTEKIVPLITNAEDTVENLLHTAVHHITVQIRSEIQKNIISNAKLLVTGGGAKNNFLIKTLQQKLNGCCELIVPDEKIIDFKEALIFAFLGTLRVRKEINCLHSVTGAKRDSSSGIIYIPY